jgi:hypothetical protein
MKRVLLLMCIMFAGGQQMYAQSGTVENSLWGVQTGVLGVWVNNETRLADAFALRSELGVTGGYAYGSYFSIDHDSYEMSSGFTEAYVVLPTITVEPRWYYNLKRRAAKGKNTAHNAGNFLALKVLGNPGFAFVSKNADATPALSVIPVWGLRRNMGRHFNFELYGGIGYVLSQAKGSALGWDFSIRFGYLF